MAGVMFAVRRRVFECADVLLSIDALRALVSWPKFSVTSFEMVSSLRRQGLRPRTIIDVGANVGQFAIAAAMLFRDAAIHSIEPVPDSAERLARNVRKLDAVKVYPFALGDQQGEAQIHINSHSHSSSLLPLDSAHQQAFPSWRELGEKRVPVSTLDALFQREKLAEPVLLKLDVQGYEAAVLRGGPDTLRRTQYVLLEASFRPMYKGEVLFTEITEMMRRFGFRFLRPVGFLPDPCTGEILQMDALFSRDGSRVEV